MQGGRTRVQLPAAHALKSNLQVPGSMEQVGVGSVETHPETRNESKVVPSVVIVESGIPLGGETSVKVEMIVPEIPGPKIVSIPVEVLSPPAAGALGWPSHSLKVSKIVDVSVKTTADGKSVVVVCKQSTEDTDKASH